MTAKSNAQEAAVMISTERLTDVFVEVADTLITDFDLVDFLHQLTDRAAAVSGAAAAGVMLVDEQEQLRYMAASNETGEMLELFQLQNAEGPTLDCYSTRAPVVNADLATASTRWPTFAPAALRAGFQSVHAFPMRLRDSVIGALILLGHADVAFSPEEVRLVQALADVATIALLQEPSVARSESLTEQLEEALNSRAVIEQAKGVLALQGGTTPDEAFELLRSEARQSRRPLIDVATDVISGIGR